MVLARSCCCWPDRLRLTLPTHDFDSGCTLWLWQRRFESSLCTCFSTPFDPFQVVYQTALSWTGTEASERQVSTWTYSFPVYAASRCISGVCTFHFPLLAVESKPVELQQQIPCKQLVSGSTRFSKACSAWSSVLRKHKHAAFAGKDTDTCIELLHQAAATRTIAPKDLFAAIRQLEKQKLSVSTSSYCQCTA